MVQTKLNKSFTLDFQAIPFQCSLVAVILWAYFSLARIGFDAHPFFAAYPTLAVSFFILFFPTYAKSLIPSEQEEKRSAWAFSNAFLLIIGIVLVTFITWRLPFVSLGTIFFAHHLALSLFQPRNRTGLITLLLIALFSTWAAGTLWGGIYLDPLFQERLMVGWPRIGTDTLFHSAFSQMIQTYGYPSTGLDGLPYAPYHYGSHWWFAQLSTLLDMRSVEFYQLGFPVLCIPLLIYALLQLSRDTRILCPQEEQLEKNLSPGIMDWLILAIAFMGAFPDFFIQNMASDNFMVVSESYVLGITFSFILSSLILAYVKSNKYTIGKNFNSHVFFLFALPCCILITGALKNSLVYLWFCALTYGILRLRIYKNILFVVFFLMTLGLCLSIMPLFKDPTPLQLQLFSSFRLLPDRWVPHYFLIHFFLGIAFVVLKLSSVEVKNIHDFQNALKLGRILDIELFIVLAIGGIIPGMFLTIPTGADVYFSGVQQYFSLVLLIAWLLIFSKKFSAKTAGSMHWRHPSVLSIILVILFVPILVTSAQNTESNMMAAIEKNVLTRRDILIAAGLGEKIVNLNSFSYLSTLLWEPKNCLWKTRNFKIISHLQQLREMREKEKKQTALYIPQNNTAYWALPLPHCDAVPFVAPALSGLALIGGLAPDRCQRYVSRNYDSYDLREVFISNKQMNDARLCARAKLKGFKNVIVLDESNGNIIPRRLSCE